MEQPCQSVAKEPKNTLHIVYHSVSCGDESSIRSDESAFEQKLHDISEQIVSSGLVQNNQLTNLVVESVCLSSDYIALLLDNGRVCRISYKCKVEHKAEPSSTNASTYRQSSRQSFSNSNLREAFIIPSSHELMVQNSGSLSSYPVFNPSSSSRNRRHATSHYNSHILRGRVNSLIVGSSRIPSSMVAAPAVPESLIENVQTVLQSKSRSVIMRELQRTNLDVNLAVNNLLQRDDEGDEQTDEDDDPLSAVAVAAAAAAAAAVANTNTAANPPSGHSQTNEPYIHGDDLMSLLDINSGGAQSGDVNAPNENDSSSSSSSSSSSTGATTNNTTTATSNSTSGTQAANANQSIGMFDEENFRLIRRFGNSIIGTRSSEERDATTRKTSSYRLRDNRWYESYRDDLFNRSEAEDKAKKSEPSATARESCGESVITFGDNIQYWIEKRGDTPQFVRIASLYSELVAVCKEGKLHQWKWSSDIPYSVETEDKKILYHPKSGMLGLANERIVGLSSSLIRGCCWTESGKVACWFDESVHLTNLTSKYETECTAFSTDRNLSANEKIIEMSTSNLFTVYRTSLGSVYWWGLMPYELRLKTFEKQQTKIQSRLKFNCSEISVGSIVSLKSLPIFNTGTFGLTVREGQPFVGQLAEHVFSYRENKAYKFKVKKASSFLTELNPTPNSPTLTSPQTQVIQGSLKRKKQYLNQENKKVNLDELRDESDFEKEEREENWLLSDVFFMDDAKTCNVLGQVIKIDSDYALVRMSDSKAERDPLENTRIFAKSQLQLAEVSNFSLKSNCDQFVQKCPKKIADLTNVLTTCAQQGFIHAIISKESSIVYVQYDLASGKFLKEKRFPTNCVSAFCGNNMNNISLRTIDEPNFNMFTLFDGNSTIYPFTDLHGSNTLKDPEWKNLFPFKSFSQTVLIPVKSPSTTSANQTKKIHFVTLFSMKIEQLMASILRCDLNRVFKILRQLENDLSQLGTNALSKRLKRIINERCDGNRNIIHAAVYCCSPISNNQLNISSNLGDIKTSAASAAGAESNEAYTCSHSSNKIERPWSVSFQNQSAKADKKMNMSLPSMQIQSSYSCDASNTSPSSASVPFWPPPPPPPPPASSATSEPSKANSTQIFAAVKLNERDKMQNSLKILNLLLNSSVINGKLHAATNTAGSSAKKPNADAANINYLLDLLTHRNSAGETPFMYAVSLRAYDAALLILEVAVRVRVDITKSLLDNKKDKEAVNFYNRDLLFTNMICPVGSRADQSPLFVLCANDTCSFTWTGDNHITQDIFECRTCSLVGNLCCCSECARTCHKGHECRVKKSSPTAYCDCWEKCKCKSLIGGDQDKRFELFDKLLKQTNLLLTSTDKSGQHLLLTLIHTCARQLQEQKNYRRHTGNSSVSSASSSTSSSTHRAKRAQVGEMPQHDLEPPKFSLKALNRIFAHYDSFKHIFLLGDSTPTTPTSASSPHFHNHKHWHQFVDQSLYVDEQSWCQDLDKFVYYLVHKCPNQLLLTLVDSLRSTLGKEQGERAAECNRVVQRLVNATARLFVALCMETSAAALNLNLDYSVKNCAGTIKLIRQCLKSDNHQISLVNVSALTKCEFVFKEFAQVACVQLAEAAISLITPVMLGTLIPTSFKLGHTQPTSSTATSAHSSANTAATAAAAHLTADFSAHVASHTSSLSEQIFNGEVSAHRQNSNCVTTSLVLPLAEISVASASAQMVCEVELTVSDAAANDDDDDELNDDEAKSTIEQHDQDGQHNDDGNDDDDGDDGDDDDDDDDDGFFKGEQRIKLTDEVMESDGMEADEDERAMESDGDEDNDNELELEDECDFELSISQDDKATLHQKPHKDNKNAMDKPKTTSIPISTRTSRINSHVNSLIQQYGAAAATTNSPLNNTDYTSFYTADSSQSSSTLPTSNTLAINNTALPVNSINTMNNNNQSTTDTKPCAQNTPSTVQITKNTLSRVFSILVKQVRDLLNSLNHRNSGNNCDEQQRQQIRSRVNERLMPVFEWMSRIMESSEAQLRFATAFTSIQLNSSDSTDYLRHLEEKALLNNYYMNNSLPFGATSTSASSATNSNTNTTTATTTPTSTSISSASAHYSSRFGSGIDARRKLNIMQHQHQTNASTIQQQLQQQQTNNNHNPQLIGTQRDFIAYTLSLMRQHTSEHRDSIPHTDIAQLKHVAYVLDAFLFYLRHDRHIDLDLDRDRDHTLRTRSGDRDYDSSSSSSSSSSSDSSDDDLDLDLELGANTPARPFSCTYRKSRFFKRSKSVKCVGARSPDPFRESINDTLPLAVKPHLLQPYSRIQDMFKCQTNHANGINGSGDVCHVDLSSTQRRTRTRTRKHKHKQQSRDHKKLLLLTKFHRSMLNLSRLNFNDINIDNQNDNGNENESESGECVGKKRWHCLLNKWRLTSDLFGRVFCDDIGAEIGSTLRQMAGFQPKESKFRREMERLKNMASRELIMEVERERDKLLYATFKSLNNTYNLQCSRRAVVANNATHIAQAPPLCLSRVKVTFKDEQGEGSGVARSFYTAFSEAVLSEQPFAQFDLASMSKTSTTGTASHHHHHHTHQHHQYVPFNMQRYRNSRSSSSAIYSSSNTSNNNISSSSSNAHERNRTQTNVILRSSLRPSKDLLPAYTPATADSQSPVPTTPSTTATATADSQSPVPTTPSATATATTTVDTNDDNLPLFWQSDKKSANRFQYSPVLGKCSPSRLNAFRNVGRVIAICLLQNELCPITLSRHVLKYILNRPVRWHDLAFYDSQMYESFRKMIDDAEQFLCAAIADGLGNSKTGSDKALKEVIDRAIEQCNEQVFGALDFTFNIDLPSEESALTNVDLVENGANVHVNCVNMYQFVKLYAEYRMLKNVEPCLKELRAGVLDVLPANALDGLYAEDLRLLLNGVADINIHVLASYTTISDESKESAKRAHFEKWFWSTVDKMSQQEKQELLFFWTGSPYLPASDDGFQPLPTITLRPPSDQLLPTANTCINRLYIPIYSSRTILKSKLLLAIKTKTFGFV